MIIIKRPASLLVRAHARNWKIRSTQEIQMIITYQSESSSLCRVNLRIFNFNAEYNSVWARMYCCRAATQMAKCPYVAVADIYESAMKFICHFIFFHAPPHLIIYLFTWFLCPSATKIWWHFEGQAEFCDDDKRNAWNAQRILQGRALSEGDEKPENDRGDNHLGLWVWNACDFFYLAHPNHKLTLKYAHHLCELGIYLRHIQLDSRLDRLLMQPLHLAYKFITHI